MTATTTLTAYNFGELLRKVDPHIGRHSGYAAIQGIHLDYSNGYLHAVATDRYTFAVARQATRSNDPAWALTVRMGDLPALAAWIDSLNGEKNVHIFPYTEGLTFESEGSKLVIPAGTATFPDWRGMVRTALEEEPGQAPYSGFDSTYLGRWETAGRILHTWQAVPTKPLIVVGHDFLGMQMPVRVKGEPSISIEHAAWAGTLGGGDKVEQLDTLHPFEPEELADRENVIPDTIEDLLQQVLRSTTDLFGLATRDPGALAAYALAGGRAWMAYRLLKALEKADPDLLRATIADADEQLESGEIGEWAWDEAAAAGHDPQAWRDDYEAHLKKLAEKRAAEAAPAT
ncbi:hypothetical protein [Streptomyces sp. NPDC059970]|uniref:hypothetical protein n=1 Tax=Streptomyces sp. NPDC059970 TaxID=3347019 RepID=UPI0036CF67EF